MRTKKQRIMSFLMAFLLIFTFAFINPLTVSKSDAFAFTIPAMTPTIARIITGVLVSAGFIIHEGNTPSLDLNNELISMSEVIYRSLDNAQKVFLGAMSIIDNIIEVPVSIYNSIVNNANSLYRNNETNLGLVEQDIDIRFAPLTSSSDLSYPKFEIPFYVNDSLTLTNGNHLEKLVDMSEAEPYIIYHGVDNAETNDIYADGVSKFFLEFPEGFDLVERTTTYNEVILTPSLFPYNLAGLSGYKIGDISFASFGTGAFELSLNAYSNPSSVKNSFRFINIPASLNLQINDLVFYSYLLFVGNKLYTITDFYNKENGLFQNQFISSSNLYGFFDLLNTNKARISPLTYDMTFSPDTTITPPVTNTAGDNVITLPSELTGVIGSTSSDVNVGSSDIPDTPNTEIMDNINTNVGELVTGGELGEQVNTNLGTLEGLHGELTEQVDFGAVFETISEYISSLDISSVTWFPVAVAGFLVPFLPVISLGIILFFIDRVLNGGA